MCRLVCQHFALQRGSRAKRQQTLDNPDHFSVQLLFLHAVLLSRPINADVLIKAHGL